VQTLTPSNDLSFLGKIDIVEDQDHGDVQACLAGDERAFERLLTRHQATVASQVWGFVRNQVDCEELVQEIFVEAFCHLDTFRGEAPFLHWLRRIASRVGYRYLKKTARQALALAPEDVAALKEAQVPPNSEAAGRVARALLAKLNPEDRLLMTLVYLEDCSLDEIGSRLGINEGAVKMRMFRARQKLRKIVEDEDWLEEIAWTS